MVLKRTLQKICMRAFAEIKTQVAAMPAFWLSQKAQGHDHSTAV
jgi:hypothetical protein